MCFCTYNDSLYRKRYTVLCFIVRDDLEEPLAEHVIRGRGGSCDLLLEGFVGCNQSACSKSRSLAPFPP